MSTNKNMKYTVQAQTGIRGEAFFESIIAKYAIPHHIVGQKDIGIDYICEWVTGDNPTGILFSAQIKTYSCTERCHRAPKKKNKQNEYNGLEEYIIANANLNIKPKTLNYWKGLGMPAYLFVVWENTTKKGDLKCFYKRYSRILTGDLNDNGNDSYSKGFCRVSEGAEFLAFANTEKKEKGFTRDLFIDYMRWSYFRGMITNLKPSSLGLKQFSGNKIVLGDIFKEYMDNIKSVCNWTFTILKEAQPDYEPSPVNYATLASTGNRIKVKPSENV